MRKIVTLHIRKNTQKSKFLLSQAFKWGKKMFFVIPEMPSKTFVMVLKKLPDHFNKSDGSAALCESMIFTESPIKQYRLI